MEIFGLIIILIIIFVLIAPAIALNQSKEAVKKAEEAKRDSEEALHKAEEALRRMSKIQEGDLVAGKLEPGIPIGSLMTAESVPVAEVISVREMIALPESMAFTLWTRDTAQLVMQSQRNPFSARNDAAGKALGDPNSKGPEIISVEDDSQEKKRTSTNKLKSEEIPPESKQSGPDQPPAESIEMKLGTYWFVRIGVMLLLTGAGILAFYKRQFFIDLPPAAKVSCLYLFSGLLGGIGFWLQHTRETLRNYGQVLVAGGFSGVYFTTYAAHIFDPVKVISDPTVTLLLLLSWGGFMAWVANRLRSETVALFAVGAAYYATYVPLIHVDSGGISHWVMLASNVILAITAVAFMLRNRWFKMPLLSMSAAYAGFVLWRVRVEEPAPLLLVLLFAASLWVIYSAAVFLSRHDAFNDRRRAAFLSANNAAFFGFLTWDLLREAPQYFWILPLTFGIVLLGAALSCKRLIAGQVLSGKAFLTQGLVLMTLGLMTTQLSESIKGPILAAETVVLFFMAIRQENKILKWASILVAVIACGFGVYDIGKESADFLGGCLVITSFLLFAGWLSHHRLEKGSSATLRPVVSYFSGLAVLLGLIAYMHAISADQISSMAMVILAGAALLFTASFYLLRVREFVLFGQVPVMVALVFSLLYLVPTASISTPLLLLMAVALVLVHWWRWQRHFITEGWGSEVAGRTIPLCIEGVLSAGVILQILKWLVDGYDLQQQWVWIGPLLALAIIVYGALTRAPFLAAFGQVFLWMGLFFSLESYHSLTSWRAEDPWPLLVPIVGFILSSLAIKRMVVTADLVPKLEKFALFSKTAYRWVAVGLGVLWIQHSIPEAYQVIVSFAVAFLFLLSCLQRRSGKGKKTQILYFACAYAVTAGCFLIVQFANGAYYWQSLVVIAVVIILQLWMRKRETQSVLSNAVHNVLIASGSSALFVWLTIWIGHMTIQNTGALLTLLWAGVGLLFFVLGMCFRERGYGWSGLIMLSCALLSMITHFGEGDAQWQTLMAICIVIAVQRIARIANDRLYFGSLVHNGLIVSVGVALFFWVTTWIASIGGENLDGMRSISWTGVGLISFLFGLLFKERVYRLTGLTVLGIALLSLVPIIWGFSTEWKIASFFVLGMVFVGLGFVYNRFREKINKML